MKHHLKLLVLILLFTVSSQSVKTQASIVEKSGLTFVGEGLMSVLFWDVYLAKLYTPDGKYEGTLSPLALEFNYQMDIEARDLIEETVNQWREQDLDVHPQEESWVSELYSIWPDVEDGDQLLFRIDDDLYANFYYNQTWVGAIKSKDFSERFAAIWLSEKTTAPKVRKKLLGQ